MADDLLVETARAKLNLDLLVTGRREDGYHELDSLVVFVPLADRLTFEHAPGLSLEVTGPFAGGLGPAEDNLVLRAARMLAAAAGRSPAFAIRLEKLLPVASGIGGGSADAAATLRGLARLFGLDWPADRLRELGLDLGADVPVCLWGRPARLRGIGERLDPVRGLPGLPLVLVNPGIGLGTAAVFRARDPAGAAFARPASLPHLSLTRFALGYARAAVHRCRRAGRPPAGAGDRRGASKSCAPRPTAWSPGCRAREPPAWPLRRCGKCRGGGRARTLGTSPAAVLGSYRADEP
ncbi:MAG: 4-(cytidine 5'-diphospho)-2-C-methyl-D-erythritol kinase [Geminicoccaceae bacterium]